MAKKDKVLIGAMILLVILLAFKSFVLDTYKTKNEAETVFLSKIEKIIEDEYSGGLYKYRLINVKVVRITEMSERERTVTDKDGGEYEATGVYKAKIRKYILGILPFSEESILDIDLEKE
jgi:hypothetical protein